MRRIPIVIYQTPAEIEDRIRELEIQALDLHVESAEHRQIMQDIAKLRIYADAKRWLTGPAKPIRASEGRSSARSERQA